MKLKFLSLLLAFSIFAMGTSVSATATESNSPEGAPTKVALEEKGAPEFGCPMVDWTTVITKYVCKAPGLGLVESCKKWCEGLSSGKAIIADAEACMSTLEGNLSKYGSVITNLVKQGCNLGCSGNVICNSCKDQQYRQRCGIVCCAIDKSKVSSCMSYNKDSCKNYMDTGSKEAF